MTSASDEDLGKQCRTPPQQKSPTTTRRLSITSLTGKTASELSLVCLTAKASVTHSLEDSCVHESWWGD